MQTLRCNTQPIYYATYVGKTEVIDGDGNQTGQYDITYSAPVKAMWNVGYIETDAEVAMFGIAATSTLRIVAPKRGFPLDEASILWYGKAPEEPYDETSPKHNYAVAGIRPSMNELVFYARKVDVS